MLAVAGLKSMDELFGEIPQQLLFNREFNLPEAMSEVEIRNWVNATATLYALRVPVSKTTIRRQ